MKAYATLMFMTLIFNNSDLKTQKPEKLHLRIEQYNNYIV